MINIIMATAAAWSRFHFAVRGKGVGSPNAIYSEKWVISPEIPPTADDPETPESEEDPGRPEVRVFVKPVQYRALSISAGRANIPVYS